MTTQLTDARLSYLTMLAFEQDMARQLNIDNFISTITNKLRKKGFLNMLLIMFKIMINIRLVDFLERKGRGACTRSQAMFKAFCFFGNCHMSVPQKNIRLMVELERYT